MAISIPNPENPTWQQNNRSDILGNITESFNLDLRINLGAVRVNRSKLILDSDEDANFDFGNLGYNTVGQYQTQWYSVSSIYVFGGANSAFDVPTLAAGSTTPGTSDEGDTITFNGKAWIAGETKLWKSAVSGLTGTWTDVTSSGLTASRVHLLAVLGNRLYVTDAYDQIYTVNSSEVFSTSGTGTLDLGLEGYSITVLMAGNDRVWVAASPFGNNSTGQYCWVYEWDGETENTPIKKYIIQTSHILAGCMVEDVPYLIDARGRLLAYDGYTFKEIARFPMDDRDQLWGVGQAPVRNKAVHPRGMIYDGDEILININNRLETSSSDPVYTDRFAAGIWAYNRENGLYHKFSHSYVDTSDTGTTVTDYGQFRAARVGNIIPFRPNNPDSSDGGAYIWSCSFFEDADSGSTDAVTGVFTNDTFDNTQKWGYFVTAKIFASAIADTWQKIYTIYKKFLDSGDKIVVKYRTEEDDPTEASITWVDTDTFTTTTNVSDYEEGDEVQIIQGVGGGKSAHISSISEAGGTYTVDLDDTFTGATTTTAKAFFSKWVKAGEITQPDDKDQYKALTLMEKNESPWVQFKVCMQFTGANEIYKHRVINQKLINE